MASEFLAELEEIFTGSQAGFDFRWTATNFFDKVVLAQSSVMPQYWPGGGPARPVPGLPAEDGWDGVTAMAGHLLLWRDDRVKYCDLDDFTTWIPVLNTATTARATIASPFMHPKPGFVSDWVYTLEPDKVFTPGGYARIDLNADDPTSAIYNFYLINSVADTSGLSVETIGVEQVFSRAGAGRIFTTTYVEWPVGSRLIIGDKVKALTVTGNSNAETLILTTSAPSDPLPLPLGTFHVSVSTNPSKLKVGDVLSAGDIDSVGADL